MSDVNRAELIGYCGADPISNDVGDGLRVTKSGKTSQGKRSRARNGIGW